MLIFLLSANHPPLYMRPNCGVFLLLPNLPAYELAKMSDFYGVSSPRQTNLSLYYYYMNSLLVYQECNFINYLPHHITYFQHLCLLTFRKASTPECSFLHQRNAQSSLFTFLTDYLLFST